MFLSEWERSAKWIMKNEIKYFSMFTGVGGFELGLQGHEAGGESRRSSRCRKFKCVGYSEIDKFSSRVLRHKFPSLQNYGDATQIKPRDLPDFDLLCGGFPCQAFSIAGKRGGFTDSRGTLFFEIARILKAKRPKALLLENVKGLLHHEGGATFRVIVQTLGQLGYDVQWMVLNSKFFGVPQNRERVFLVGHLRGSRRPQILPFTTSAQASAELSGQQTNTIKSKQGPPSYVVECEQLPETKGRPQGQRIYKTSGVSKTLIGQGGGSGGNTGLYQEGPRARRLTPKECERLQGFPDNWTQTGLNKAGQEVKMSNSQRYKQMGNAVTANVVKALAGQLAKVE